MSDLPSIENPALDAIVREFFDARENRSLSALKKALVAPSDGEELGDDFIVYADMVQGSAEEIMGMPLNTTYSRLVAVEMMGPEPPPDAPDVGVYGVTIAVKRGNDEIEEGLMVYRFGKSFKIGLAMSGAITEDGPITDDGPPS